MRKILNHPVFISVVFALMMLSVGLYINYREGKKEEVIEPTCEVVDGMGHVYRGQCLSEGFEPEVFSLSRRASWLNTQQYLDLRAKIMVEEMIADAEADGICLAVSSGYRSYEAQELLIEHTAPADLDYVAPAGGSEHQTGLAVDFVACPMRNGVRDDSVEREDLTKDFEELPEYEWLEKWAWTYGFEQSFRVDNIDKTMYPVESWHWKLIIE